MGAFYVVQLATSNYPISKLFNSRADSEKALPALAARIMSNHNKSGREGYETPAVEVAEFVPIKKSRTRTSGIGSVMKWHPTLGATRPRTTCGEHEIRAAIARQSWGAGKGPTPVNLASKDEAFRSLFVPIGGERKPLLVINDGQITRTARTPQYSD